MPLMNKKSKTDKECIYNELDTIVFYLEGIFEFAEDKEETKELYDDIHAILFTQRYCREAVLDRAHALADAGLSSTRAEQDEDLIGEA